VWVHQAGVDPKSGKYRLRELPPGTYGVFVQSAGPRPLIASTFGLDVEVRVGLSRDLQFDIPAARPVAFTTNDLRRPRQRGAAPLTGWRLRPASGDWLGGSMFDNHAVLAPGTLHRRGPLRRLNR